MKDELTILSTLVGAEMLTDKVYVTWIKESKNWEYNWLKNNKTGTMQRKHPLKTNRHLYNKRYFEVHLPPRCVVQSLYNKTQQSLCSSWMLSCTGG
jgi:hypothetical protein